MLKISFRVSLLTFLAFLAGAATAFAEIAPERARDGVVPTVNNKPLNLGFESGNLDGWKATGNAFDAQPTEGDNIRKRLVFVGSEHAGEWWVNSFDSHGDAAKGTLTSPSFKITHPWASFLVGGGKHKETRVEIVLADSNRVIFHTTGDDHETLKPVAVDLQPHIGAMAFIRLVDNESGPWGHINFDDFRFHASRPEFPQRALSEDAYQYDGLPPAEAAKAMTVPSGFSVKLFAGEPDVHQPIAMAIDDRGRLWIAEAYGYPHRQTEENARDRILIFEDTNGDGAFDTKKVFAEKLNLVSGLEVGFGGVWVGAAPHLLFIPDKDGDDKPDSAPQILLDGWGYQDTHETLNAFIWGPDGWLYGCHGVFTHSRVGKPGTPDNERTPLNAGVWRYHPTRHVFEVFAHGTSNPWGVDFNDKGDTFITACVIPHLYHMIHNARYLRQGGVHFNPYTYADINTIAKHRHWIGVTPHSGNNRSDAAGGGHAHAGAMFYLGGLWPKEYRDQLFMNNIHGARLNVDKITPNGSGYIGDRAPDFLLANDSWSQILYFTYGPDGNVFFIDWYDRNQCHRPDPNVHDRSNGRIFKIVYGESKHTPVDLKRLSDDQLVELLSNDNEWYVRHARRLLQERGNNPALHDRLAKMAFEHKDEARRLRGLWALHAVGGLSEERLLQGMKNDMPHVRGWCVQIACEQGEPSKAILAAMAKLAAEDKSQVVRRFIGSEVNGLPHESRWDILAPLIRHVEDSGDHNLPLIYWYALEPLAAVDPQRALTVAMESSIKILPPYTARRVAALNTSDSVATLVATIAGQKKPDIQASLLSALNQAYEGQRRIEPPKGWAGAFAVLQKSKDPRVSMESLKLATTFGDPAAFAILQKTLTDKSQSANRRREALRSLLKGRAPGLEATLQTLLAEPALRIDALRGLASYDNSKSAPAILEQYAEWNANEKREAIATLMSRPASASLVFDAIEAKRIPATDLSADLVRQARNLKNAELSRRIEATWGAVNDTPAEKVKLIEDWKRKLTTGKSDDVALGRAVFEKTCSQCHKLFGTGGAVGPELTGSNRANLDYVLSNIIDPSAVIGKDYQATMIVTNGRSLIGLVKAENDQSVTLVTATETVVIPKDEIEAREQSAKSMMPDDILKPLAEREVAALVSYLASSSQTPMLATKENAASFFDGQTLNRWVADKEWTVEKDEIVGRPSGGAPRMRSEMLVRDFRLRFEFKPVTGDADLNIYLRSLVQEKGSLAGIKVTASTNAKRDEQSKGTRVPVKKGEWSTIEVTSRGDRVELRANGSGPIILDATKHDAPGVIAFDLFANGGADVRLRNLKLELLDDSSATARRGN